MQGEIQISTDLPFGRGTVSCDIVVLRREPNKLLYLFATNSPACVELYYSPEHTFTQVNISRDDIAAAIKWANKEYKTVHMLNNCNISNSPVEGIMAMQYMMLGLVSEKGLHPPGLCARTQGPNLRGANLVGVMDVTSRNRQGKECDGRVFRILPEGGDLPAVDHSSTMNVHTVPHSAVLAFETDYVEGRILNIPQPVPRTDADSVNCTIMLLGRTFEHCEAVPHVAPSYNPGDLGEPDNTPSWLAGCDVNTCRIMYICPTPVRMSLGLHCDIANGFGSAGAVGSANGAGEASSASSSSSANGASSHRSDDRVCVCLNGSRMLDRTEKRLMTCTEVKYFSVPTVCGCAIRDLVHFERPHIPLLLAPKTGMEYVFEDHPEGVQLTIDGVPSGIIRTVNRHTYDGILWADWTRN